MKRTVANPEEAPEGVKMEGPTPRHNGQDPRKQVLIFNHIPKNAGSTFKTILWRQYHPQRVFFSMTPAQHVEKFEALRRQIETGHPPVDVVVTHAGHGLHALLPDTHQYPYITFLREPIDRVISGYYMFVRQGKVPADISLEDFVRTFLKPGCNMQTSFLSGYFLECHLAGRMPERAAFTGEMLAKAKTNLERHTVVGLTERFDVSLMMLREAFGWRMHKLLYYRTNVGQNRKPREAFSEEALKVVREYNDLDLELYAYAEKLFEERRAARKEALEKQLNTFQSLNRIYAATAPRVLPLLRGVRKRLRF